MYDEKIQLLIDGVWREGSEGKSQPLVNPATGEEMASVPHASSADLDEALAAADKGFRVWKSMTAIERYRIMMKAADLIDADLERIARLLTMENGKPLVESRGEVAFSADATRWYAEEGKRAYGRIVPGRIANQRQIVLKEPVGVVAAFAAWNFPASNVIRKVAGALGAGCSIILKTAEETPGTAVAFARCFEKAGVPAGVINLVFGVPDEVSSHLLASPIPKKVSLTGSTAVGKLLQQRAAETLKRCTMELGGHAPVIVHHDADVELAVATLAAAKFRNAGQVCTSPTRFFVHETIYGRFLELFVARVAQLKIGNGLDADTQMGPMIAARRLDAIQSLVDDAVGKGARLLTGGKSLGGKGFFYAPTVLADVPDNARIMQEEPFGPVASFQSFSTFDDVIARANATPYGLASFVFTTSGALAHQTELALDAGMVGVNNTAISTPETPFGGVNASGYGSESGIEGLEAFQRVKTVSEIFP
ncbi:succinate-semialdehyde dehydrogenase / glutarate-semialdehyde dehydrogenase [Arboricoccus pini]|uniref:Succinate-semialdehyde dehydrogenase / glutarate-semialdehyde dehydrogenase n=1 Tax=Arboricoccus pini TaxID=1963835 RepID=A0A212RWY6_9PROT|nr:NAD-dependent succinate-semialdehyde dehydrogenase [Arboricoccus pini]SNB77131.1 succinate-semialdehyde dehydrogenase / glutarate-semialdehyde dehydrogenase [Arboricoccus pini]